MLVYVVGIYHLTNRDIGRAKTHHLLAHIAPDCVLISLPILACRGGGKRQHLHFVWMNRSIADWYDASFSIRELMGLWLALSLWPLLGDCFSLSILGRSSPRQLVPVLFSSPISFIAAVDVISLSAFLSQLYSPKDASADLFLPQVWKQSFGVFSLISQMGTVICTWVKVEEEVALANCVVEPSSID